MTPTKPIRCYIGIGSNLAGPLEQVQAVLPHLDAMPKSRLINQSSLYESEAVSDIEQEDYINAVACIETRLTAVELLLELQAIEHAFYRNREHEVRWGPRTMDLDILLYGFDTIHDSHLTIPHPEMKNRLFVLLPLYELMGDVYIPTLGSLEYLVNQAPPMRIHQLVFEE